MQFQKYNEYTIPNAIEHPTLNLTTVVGTLVGIPPLNPKL